MSVSLGLLLLSDDPHQGFVEGAITRPRGQEHSTNIDYQQLSNAKSVSQSCTSIQPKEWRMDV